MKRDFAALAARLLQQSRSLLPHWFPAGKWRGHEFVLGNLSGEPGDSLSINSNTGQWSDFASGDKGGDLLSLYAAAHNLKQSEAYDALEDGTISSRVAPAAAPPRAMRERRAVEMPVPEGVAACACRHYKYGKPSRVWDYRDAEGRLLGHVARYDPPGERKQVVPWTYASGKWGMGQFPAPRPLYGLAELAARPEAPVIVVEGEKAADAARGFCPQYVVVTWPGGSQAWNKASFAPLRGRPSVLLWPDADEPGIKCMYEIGHALLKLCAVVKLILPDGVSDGFDAADAVADGWDWQRFKEWALPRVKLINEAQHGGSGNGVTTEQQGIRDAHNGSQDGRQAGYGGEAQDDGHDGERGGVPAGQDIQERTGSATDSGGASPSLEGEPESASGSPRGAAASEPHTSPGELARPPEPVGDRQGAPLAQDTGPDADDHREPGAAERVAGGPRSARGGAVTDGRRAGRSSDGFSGGDQPAAGSDRQAEPARADLPARAPSDAPQSQVARWIAWGLDRNGNGLPLANLHNAVIVLERDPALRGLVWYDEFLQRLMTGAPAREWTDADDDNLTLYMQRDLGIVKMGNDATARAARIVAYRNMRNTVKEFLDALPAWDQVDRCNHFFVDVFGAAETAYATAVGGNFWKALVARALYPGCKVDNVVVLEGKQGLRKSTALNHIVGDAWFAEAREEVTSKDFYVALQGKWLIEIAELDAFSRADVTKIKQVVTCRSDRFRAPYGRVAVDHPRQGIFMATVNGDTWNRDETGARRFWPIRCEGQVDIARIDKDRLQYFAEAVSRVKAGEDWWTMPEEETRAEQRARYVDDPWMAPIATFLAFKDEITTGEILGSCLSIETARVDRSHQMRAATCLRMLGWEKLRGARRNGHVVNLWKAPEGWVKQANLELEVAARSKVAADSAF